MALVVALFNDLAVAVSRLLSKSERGARYNAEQIKNELHGGDGFHHVDGCRCRYHMRLSLRSRQCNGRENDPFLFGPWKSFTRSLCLASAMDFKRETGG